MAGAGSDGRDEPNLELPSFFGRRRKRQAAEADGPGAETSPDTSTGTSPDTAPSTSPAAPALRPAARAKRVPPPRRGTPAEEPAATQPVARPEPTPAPEPEPRPEPTPAAAPAPVRRRLRPAARTAEPAAAPAPAPAPTPAPVPARGPEMTYDAEPTTVLTAPRPEVEEADHADDGTGDASGKKPRRRPSVALPRVGPWLAAALGGAVAALVGVLLAWLALRGCEAVRGVSSCGGGPGLLLLFTVVVAEVLVGAAVLRAFRVVQPAGTSTVGVGLVVVMAMFFPAVAVTSVAAAVVLPVATALTFVLAHVAATTVVDLGD